MNAAGYPRPKGRHAYMGAVALILAACSPRPWLPVNVGRENGNPTIPFAVSHIPEKNQWVLARTKPHNIFQQLLCFNYACRRMVGRRKALGAISFKKFVKEIEKNRKKGVYKNMTPTVPASPKRTQTRDTAIVAKESAPVATPKSEFSVPAPILKSDSLITLSEFLFETDSHTLREKHFSQLDSIGAFLLTHPTLEVNISGHTDNRGNESHNVTLSQRRAEGVAQYLAGKGVAPGKIKFQGFGSAKPIQGNQTKEGRGKNRRVEILISNPKKK